MRSQQFLKQRIIRENAIFHFYFQYEAPARSSTPSNSIYSGRGGATAFYNTNKKIKLFCLLVHAFSSLVFMMISFFILFIFSCYDWISGAEDSFRNSAVVIIYKHTNMQILCANVDVNVSL